MSTSTTRYLTLVLLLNKEDEKLRAAGLDGPPDESPEILSTDDGPFGYTKAFAFEGHIDFEDALQRAADALNKEIADNWDSTGDPENGPHPSEVPPHLSVIELKEEFYINVRRLAVKGV